MDRQRAKELYSDYLEGELEGDELRELEAFLAETPEAKAEIEALRKTLSGLFGMRQAAPPPKDFVRKVERRIQRRSRGRFFAKGSQRLLWRIPFEWISFIIILLLLALYMTTMLGGRKVKDKAPKPGSAERAPRPARPASPKPPSSTKTTPARTPAADATKPSR